MSKKALKKLNDFETVAPLDGVSISGAGVTISIRNNLAIVQLFAKSGSSTKIENLLKIKNVPGVASKTKTFSALPLAPNQWMMISNKGSDGTFGRSIAKRIRIFGHVSEQSDGRICIRISGPKARELMSRGCRLDLHPSVAKTGFCAQTTMAQVGVLLHQISDEPAYDLYVFPGFAHSFWQWLEHTAKQFNALTFPTPR